MPKVNNQDQNVQKTPAGLGNAKNINKPQVRKTVEGRLGMGTSPNNQTNNRMPISMKKKMSPNSQKQDAFPTSLPGGKINGSKVGGSGLGTDHLFGRAKLALTKKLPSNTAPNNQKAAKFEDF